MTTRVGRHAFGQFEGSLGRVGSIRAVFMGDGTDFEIPKTAQDVHAPAVGGSAAGHAAADRNRRLDAQS